MVSGVPVPVGWAGKRVLVTGATGFIGRRLTRQLVEADAQTWTTGLPGEHPPPGVEAHLPLDARDGDAVRAIVAEAAPQVVFHLAAAGVTAPGIDPALALAVNVGGALHLLEVLRERGIGRIVLVGTCHEYGAREMVEGGNRTDCYDPFNAYAASKVAAWAFGRMYWRMYGLPVIIVRPFQVYGPGQLSRTLVPAAIRAALAGEDFPMTPGQQQRDFIYVDDVVDGMLAAAAAPHLDGESLDLGTGQARAILRVVERIWAMTDAQGKILAGRLPYRTGAVMRLVADADRAAHLTGWRARVGLEEGLKRTIEMIRFSDD
ncbi:MAG: hypothetical protein B6I35_04665 [Anaerolineaceae bacterium 4572_32.2]|nr:MAG: hypothetical protein B6I35_04665 [Anaerolineaceae bacterium 4572_32.2]HEY73965.1 NAD(P)-dependent oxidoreductase [Thermoflexia bacterium]